LFCKYKTVCATSPILTSEGRRKLIPLLHHAVKYLAPEINHIQEILRNQKFTDTMPEFIELRDRIPDSWKLPTMNFSISAYLNDREQKEYALAHDVAKT
jgi:hypothetical protein